MKIGDMHVQTLLEFNQAHTGTIDRILESHVQSINVCITRDNISFRNDHLK